MVRRIFLCANECVLGNIGRLDIPITNMRFPVSDLLTCVNQLCVKEWQQLWSQCTSNKLYCVKPVIGRNRNPSLSRYDSVLINRLRIGHTRLSNLYLLKGENQPECQISHSPLTLKHILIDSICFVQHIRDISEFIHSKNFVKMSNLETLLLLLKMQTFVIVYNVVLY